MYQHTFEYSYKRSNERDVPQCTVAAGASISPPTLDAPEVISLTPKSQLHSCVQRTVGALAGYHYLHGVVFVPTISNNDPSSLRAVAE